MPEVNAQCETILPAEGVVLTAPGGPPPGSTASTTPPTPYTSTQYTVEFASQSWNIGTINSNASTEVGTAANLAILGKAKQVIVTGYAANTKLDDGTLVTETVSLAEARAERVALALTKLQVPTNLVKTTWSNAVPTADATTAYKGRIVTISVQL
jgi:outer membrane protein OmpA-like peptidoglycan-associated protein